ncbi:MULTISPECIES: lipid-binding protein [Niastella]|uniref:Lipid-binding hydrolase n=1 Tax=Niastella soli TaxID=2821487 RepID=A0ABS3YSS0_9BACT|nr:lipid-binding protein [Niastella soli]MBO9200944.1 hypothetical protein [Niastella soli]
MKSIAIIAIGMCIVFISACDKRNLPDKGVTYAEKVSNEWWVIATPEVGPVSDPFRIVTSNTSSNLDSIVIDDMENYASFRCKVKFDMTNLTFSTQNYASPYDLKDGSNIYRRTVNVTDGKILAKASKALSGTTTDSIYMVMEFSDDPGNKYTIAGTSRTMFSEDDY